MSKKSHKKANVKIPATSAGRTPPRGLFARTEAAPAKANPQQQSLPKSPAKSGAAKAKRAPTVQATPVKSTPTKAASARPAPVKAMPVRPAPVTVKTTGAEIAAATVPQNGGINITALRNSFDAQALSRQTWKERDYVQLIERLDRLQTEAFILKGKLLAESKQKFYDSNRVGWIEFCDHKLGMNYTTANQYIRVAQECDVMSHHHPELGFEHFKALLPVPAEQRDDILKGFGSGSVKKLRSLVAAATASDDEAGRASARSSQPAPKAARMLLRQLQSLHTTLSGVDFSDLPPQMAWQVSVACSQVAASLMRASQLASGLSEAEDSAPPAPARRGAAQAETPKIIRVDLENNG